MLVIVLVWKTAEDITLTVACSRLRDGGGKSFSAIWGPGTGYVNRCQNEQTKRNSIFYSNVYHTILLGDFFFVNYIVEFKQVYL